MEKTNRVRMGPGNQIWFTSRREMEVAAMLEGKCPNCGSCFYGWALKNPLHQKCNNCGTRLEVWDESGHLLIEESPSGHEACSTTGVELLFAVGEK